MLPRRSILALLLLLPLAGKAEASTSVSKKKHRRHPVEAAALETSHKKTFTASSTTAVRVSTSSSASQTALSASSRAAAAKLSTHAVDVIQTTESSLYDRRTAQAPSSGFTNWFGPKADGIRYDSRMIQAARIAEARARQHSVRSCWRYVKEALLAANVVNTYPQTALAKQAGDELINRHGFRRLSINDPFKAPIGSVLVYGGRGAGHVEIRTADGFVSDFESPTPSKRPLLGVFVKPS